MSKDKKVTKIRSKIESIADKEVKKFEKELVSGNFDLGKFLKDYQKAHEKYLETKRRRKKDEINH